MEPDPSTSWYPVARSDDLPLRHVFQGELLGRELAIWRADDGFVNVWENRCLHRGVRLSIGLNEGRELRCQYHGWRYANRTAGCTYIPAHPADAPARVICNVTFPAVERYGLVWTCDSPGGVAPGDGPPVLAALEAAAPLGLRNLPVNAEPSTVLDELAAYAFVPTGLLAQRTAHDRPVAGSATLGTEELGAEVSVTDRGHSWIELTARMGEAASRVVLFVQPVDSARSVVRGVLAGGADGADGADGAGVHSPERDQMAVLRHHHRELSRLRDAIEDRAARRPSPVPMTPRLQQVRLRPAESALEHDRRDGGRRTGLRVSVARRWDTADAIVAFELRQLDGLLPTPRPGAHIDVELPNGLVRQYSLVNGPGETDRYLIGVKREPASRGGSACLHDTVIVGDVLAISEPRNNFPLRRDSFRTILIAGGIGITPLLSMAQALHWSGHTYELHYFAQSAGHVAFTEILDSLGPDVTTHLGLDPSGTGSVLTRLLSDPEDGGHVYVCGPGPMLDATRNTATTAGWPDHAVHFEYFTNATEIDSSSSFEVELARSALTLPVPAGSSIMDVLRANGVAVASSCEQGACGTCLTAVIAGEPDHQDVYLNASERRAGDRMAICVSRSRSPRLVLDI